MARAENTTTPAAGKGTRPRKSLAEKAVAELDAAEKLRNSAQAKFDKLSKGVEPAKEALAHAEARVRFLQQNPDLPEDRRVVAESAPTTDGDTQPSTDGEG